MTRPEDAIRLPYARAVNRYPRRTVFAGSVNDPAFLVDKAGNRRFWVVPVVDIDYAHTIDMQQVWAQVLHDYRAGASPYLSPAELAELELGNADHMPVNPVLEMLHTRLDWAAPASMRQLRTCTDIAEMLGLKADRRTTTAIGRCLVAMGIERSGSRSGCSLYAVPGLVMCR